MAVSEHCLVVSSLAADAVRLRGQLEAAVADVFEGSVDDAREVGLDPLRMLRTVPSVRRGG